MLPVVRRVIIEICDSPFVGGPEKQILGHCNYLNKSSFEPVIVSFASHAKPANDLLTVARNSGLRSKAICDGKLTFPVAVQQLSALAKSCGASLIIGHGFKAGFTASAAAALVGIPYLHYFHGHTASSARVRFYEWLEIRAMQRAQAVIAVCNCTADMLRSRNVPCVVCIPNAIDFDDIAHCGSRAEVRRKLALSDEDIVIGSVGRLSIEKGHIYLVEAARTVLAKWPGAKVVLVGDGPQRQILESRVSSLEMTKSFIFAGFRADSTELMHGFDIFVLPSVTENMPVSLLEAMACGVPVVATNVGGVSEMLANTLSQPVHSRSSGAISDAICEILRQPGHGGILGDALRSRAAGFTFERQAEQLADLISGFINQQDCPCNH